MKRDLYLTLVLLFAVMEFATAQEIMYDLRSYFPPGNDSGIEFIGESPINESTVQVWPDSEITIYHAPNRYSNLVMARSSFDHGYTWTASEVIFEDTVISQYPRRTLIDKDLNLHLFVFREKTLDVHHFISRDKGKTFEDGQKIADGRIGAIRGVLETESGRIIYAYHQVQRERIPPYGSSSASFVYSDDQGATWEQSASWLQAPVYEEANENNYGLVEPHLVQIGKDSLLMLGRTQTGWLYQSMSTDDGTSWSEAVPSMFHSSNSPAHLLKLPDGRIVLTWCNTDVTNLNDFGRMYTNRETLHMAISDDNGRTWRGFREVHRMPSRNDQSDQPPRGDFGVAYPNVAYTKEGKLILVTGQGEYGGGKAIFLIKPDFLYQTRKEENFSGDLQDWMCYTFTKLQLKPVRTLGPEIIDHAGASNGRALHIRRMKKDQYADAAVWNFPMGRKGEMKMRVKISEGSAGTSLSLTDHFCHPNDPQGKATAMFSLNLGGESQLLEKGQWIDLSLRWDLDKNLCELYDEKELITKLEPKYPTYTGISYIRFESNVKGKSIDVSGLLIDYVKVVVDDPFSMKVY